MMKEMFRLILIISVLIFIIQSQTIGIHFGSDTFTIGMMIKDHSSPLLMSKDSSSIQFNKDFVLFGFDSLKKKDQVSPKEIINLFHPYPGRTLEDARVKQFIEDNFISYDLDSHQNTSSISFRVKYLNQSETFSIEEIYAMLFNYIKETAEMYYKQTISSALVTIPTFYTYKEKEALRQGIELSNLALNGFVSENIAIAVDYQFNTTFSESGSITLIVNTEDWYSQVSIYNFSTSLEEINEIKTLGEGWDRSLGEREFDRKIAVFLYEKYNKSTAKLNRKMYLKFFYQVWKCKKMLKDKTKNEISLTIAELEDKPVVMKVTKDEIEQIANSLIEDIMKLITKTLSNSKLDPVEIKAIEYYGGIFKFTGIKEKIDEKVKLIMQNARSASHKSKSIAKGVTLLSKSGQRIKFTIGANSDIFLRFTNKHLHSKNKLCNEETNDINVPLYNSTCIHDLNKNMTFVNLRQGYEIQRSISFYHDTDFDIEIIEKMEGCAKESIVKTYRIADIPLLLEEMESSLVKTIPKIILLFYYNRVGQISLKAEGNYNITLYMGRSMGPGGNEEIIYTQDYTAPLSEEEIKQIDKKIEAATSEDEKLMLQFKRRIGNTKEELIQYPLSIIATYPNPQPMLKAHFTESKSKLKQFYQIIKTKNEIMLKELEQLLKQSSKLLDESNEATKKLGKEDLNTLTVFNEKLKKWYEENRKKANMNMIKSKLTSANFSIKMINEKMQKTSTNEDKTNLNEDL